MKDIIKDLLTRCREAYPDYNIKAQPSKGLVFKKPWWEITVGRGKWEAILFVDPKRVGTIDAIWGSAKGILDENLLEINARKDNAQRL